VWGGGAGGVLAGQVGRGVTVTVRPPPPASPGLHLRCGPARERHHGSDDHFEEVSIAVGSTL
jgi:hypothetical protein